MYVMTKEEVLQYFFARENLHWNTKRAKSEIQELYDDVLPTQSIYDYSLERLTVRSSKVEEDVCNIIAAKNRREKNLKRFSRYKECLDELLDSLPTNQRILYIRLKKRHKNRYTLTEDYRLREVKALLTEIAFYEDQRQKTLREVNRKKFEALCLLEERERQAELKRNPTAISNVVVSLIESRLAMDNNELFHIGGG